MRLNKFIANSGHCSRRKADEAIENGEVRVNGKVIREMGSQVDENRDEVYVNNKRILLTNEKTYILMNKPRGVITSTSDDKHRTTVIDYLPEKLKKKNLYPVGRLDYDTTGLIILTNDGEYANKLSNPRSKIWKTYIVKLNKEISYEDMKELEKGAKIAVPKGYITTKPCKIKYAKLENEKSYLQVMINEGKNRQIRKMFESKQYDVQKLTRVKIGKLEDKTLKAGDCIELTKTMADLVFE